ncbi:MAG TPA: trehalose-6-phosphate synthase [Planctomycetota bacterium]|jgi:trehalose 6-phosphate synthase|nr:trehalose-6-phosphate synthase [Planctomycetota bacterium]
MARGGCELGGGGRPLSRLVVVSNRIPTARPASFAGELEVPVGGLASAVLAALRGSRGSLWFGWSGSASGAGLLRPPKRVFFGGVEVVGLDLTATEVADYYHGFCNDALWPLLHCFQGRVNLRIEQEACYRAVQRRFAAALRPLLRPGDLVWVHDYHLFLLAGELRRLGWKGPIGFFLHTPFPPHDIWTLLLDPRGFLEALLDFDLVGFHTRSSLDNYVYCCLRLLGARRKGERLALRGRVQRAGVYPIGIDPREFEPPAERPRGGRRGGELVKVVRGRRLLLGVDRLDYTKGIPERILAFEELIRAHPEWEKKVSLVQIASPSRTAVPQYLEQRRLIESLVGRVNGELSEHDWVPIRYLFRSYPRERLARFYRDADVALVTPLRDGMNLVAKEFVAAQRPEDPCVLVLSRFAGAAEDLPEAVLVNPYVPADTAEGIARALAMPLEERCERHRALLARVLRGTADEWGRRFLADLAAVAAAARGPAAQGLFARLAQG